MKYNSEQEVFDAVVKHAEQMTRPSVVDTHCAYRSDGGNKCIVGALIEDCDYTKEMDDCTYGGGSDVLSLSEQDLLPDYLTNYIPILKQCQGAHDHYHHLGAAWKGLMIEELKDIAQRNHLDYNGVL